MGAGTQSIPFSLKINIVFRNIYSFDYAEQFYRGVVAALNGIDEYIFVLLIRRDDTLSVALR